MILEKEKFLLMKEFPPEGDTQQLLMRKEDATLFLQVTKQSRETVTGEEIKFLLEQSKNKDFTDFYDYSTNPESISIMMRYEESKTLKSRLDEVVMLFPERLAIMKAILERMLILNMPLYFLQTVAEGERIFLHESMDIRFDYNLGDIAQFESASFSKFSKKLAALVRLLFERELSLGAVPKLSGLVYGLEYQEFKSLEDIYESYHDAFKNYSEDFEIVPQNTSFKLWDKLKALASYLTIVIKIAIVAVALFYTVSSVIDYMAEPEVSDNFQTIGSRSITSE